VNQEGRSGTCPARGRRYSPAQRAEILRDADVMGVARAAKKHGCAAWTIYDWRAKARRRGTEPGRGGSAEHGEAEGDERHAMILAIWRQHPGLGPSQIRNLLKRKGFKASVSTVRAVMEEAGYVHPKLRRKEHTGRYEAIRPLQLVHLDFHHLGVRELGTWAVVVAVRPRWRQRRRCSVCRRRARPYDRGGGRRLW